MKKIISFMIAAVMAATICIGSAITAAALPGDVNSDGAVDNKDVVTLFRYISSGDKTDDETPYDYNKDGEVDNKDVVMLFRDISAGVEFSAEDETETETETEEETETETEPETEEETTEDLGEFIVEPDSEAELNVSRVIGDHMVIQRDMDITVWGTSNKDGALVRGQFMGEQALGKVKDGKWKITFSAQEATREPQTLTVEDSCGNTVTYSDILIGDVWVVGGQSNAVRTISLTGSSGLTIDTSLPVRVFQQDETDVWNNKETASTPCEDVINERRAWRTSKRSTALNSTALGWYVITRLAQVTNVPQGVVCTAAGAASMAELMPKELADSFGYKKGIYVNPGDMYNGLTHPFLNMKFKGMIFFQGESEGGGNSVPSSTTYARDFKAYMNELRSRWGFDFLIYNIQLSNYVGEECETYWTHVGEVRAQQYDAYKVMSGIRLIPSYDLGSKTTDPDGAHSPRKKDLADRVSSVILADVYDTGAEGDVLAPEPVEITVVSSTSEGKVLDIKFTNVGTGLSSLSGTDTVSGFVYGKTAHPYTYGNVKTSGTIISADTVRVTVSAAAKYIGYASMAQTAENDVPITELYNSNDLPALAFYLEIK